MGGRHHDIAFFALQNTGFAHNTDRLHLETHLAFRGLARLEQLVHRFVGLLSEGIIHYNQYRFFLLYAFGIPTEFCRQLSGINLSGIKNLNGNIGAAGVVYLAHAVAQGVGQHFVAQRAVIFLAEEAGQLFQTLVFALFRQCCLGVERVHKAVRVGAHDVYRTVEHIFFDDIIFDVRCPEVAVSMVPHAFAQSRGKGDFPVFFEVSLLR